LAARTSSVVWRAHAPRPAMCTHRTLFRNHPFHCIPATGSSYVFAVDCFLVVCPCVCLNHRWLQANSISISQEHYHQSRAFPSVKSIPTSHVRPTARAAVHVLQAKRTVAAQGTLSNGNSQLSKHVAAARLRTLHTWRAVGEQWLAAGVHVQGGAPCTHGTLLMNTGWQVVSTWCISVWGAMPVRTSGAVWAPPPEMML